MKQLNSQVVELVDAVLTTKKDIMRGKLLTDVEIIKFDGTNKKMIVDRLSIKEHSNLYFQAKDVYFIIPVHDVDEWFILDEFRFKKKILIK